MLKKEIKNGFTLVELLIVMVIIAILAGISIFAVQGARSTARDARRKADLETVRSALEMYKADCNHYPDGITFGGTNKIQGTNLCVPPSQIYLNAVPNDPLPSANYSYSRPTLTTYTLTANLEDSTTYQVTNP